MRLSTRSKWTASCTCLRTERRAGTPAARGFKKFSTGEYHRVTSNLRDLRLEMGDVAEHQLEDGDISALNRQPSLLRSAIGGHPVKVIKDERILTLGINVAACAPYNADFDGDQMNFVAPRTPAAIADAYILTAMENFFLSDKQGASGDGPDPG